MHQQEQTTEELGEENPELEHDVMALATHARDAIEDFVQEQPHAALGLAAVAGFIVGGGLTPRRLLRLGFAAGGPLLSRQLRDQVLRFASEALQGGRESEAKRSPSRRRRTKTESS